MGIRTPDLLIANETLYQLSYDPITFDTFDLRREYSQARFLLLTLPLTWIVEACRQRISG